MLRTGMCADSADTHRVQPFSAEETEEAEEAEERAWEGDGEEGALEGVTA